jgi:outer membrane protein OmpA-like peptidoglycan-associated protein
MSIRAGGVCVLAMLSLSACATQSQLRHGFEVEGQARLAADSAHQAELAAHQTQLNAQQAELAQLRTDLTALRTEFGAKIAEVAEGLKFAMPVHFAYDDATVRPADVAALERFASVVQKHYTGAKVTVEGFADPAGTQAYNLALSQRRAGAVRDFIGTRGVDPSLVNAVGYGETRQVARGAERDMRGAELNRRVVFVIETPGNTASQTMALLTP